MNALFLFISLSKKMNLFTLFWESKNINSELIYLIKMFRALKMLTKLLASLFSLFRETYKILSKPKKIKAWPTFLEESKAISLSLLIKIMIAKILKKNWCLWMKTLKKISKKKMMIIKSLLKNTSLKIPEYLYLPINFL